MSLTSNPVPATRRAFADESFRESDAGGFYVVAAAVFEPGGHEVAREVMQELYGRGRRGGKLHWNQMEQAEQRAVVKTVAGLDALHVVAVGGPVPPRRQERARAMCLHRLVVELHGYDVEHLLMEGRTERLNTQDVRTVQGARFTLAKGTRFVIEHMPGPQEPLLWAADVVAGAVRQHREGDPECRAVLEQCLYEVEVATGC
jgi:hypothetical protein